MNWANHLTLKDLLMQLRQDLLPLAAANYVGRFNHHRKNRSI